MRTPCQNGKEDGECIQVYVVLTVHMCSVCKEKEGRLTGLCAYYLRARLIRWVSLMLCTVYSARWCKKYCRKVQTLQSSG